MPVCRRWWTLKEIIIVIKNHSTTQQLGAYFWKTTAEGGDANLDVIASGDEAGCVQVSDVLYGHYLYDAPASTGYTAASDVFDVEYEFYKHIPVAQDTNEDEVINETDYTARAEVIRMYIRLNKLVEDPAKMNLNVHLNIEEYVSNYSSSQTGFVKVGTGDLTGGNTIPTAYSNSISHVTFPYGVGSIIGNDDSSDKNCFMKKDSANLAVVAISLPSSLSSINKLAFCNLHSLQSIFIPSGVTTNIGHHAFYACTSLTSMKITGSVPTLEYNTFKSCSSLKTIIIPSSVTEMDPNAFTGCNSLVAATFAETSGWTVYTEWDCSDAGTALTSENLSNTSTAATYLKTYANKCWKRTVS